MTDQHPPIRLILDTSALLAYTAGSMDVAETLNQVIENGARFGVPADVAAEALAQLDDSHDRSVLHRLLASDSCVPVDVYGDDWQELAHWRRATGSLDRAAVVLSACEHRAYVLTAEPKLYGDEIPLIEIPEA